MLLAWFVEAGAGLLLLLFFFLECRLHYQA